MFSILDILKKYQETKKKEEGKKSAPSSPDAALKLAIAGTAEATQDISISSALNKEALEENIRLTGELYAELLVFAKKLYQAEPQDKTAFKKEIIALAERAAGLLSAGSKESLRFSLADYGQAEDYLTQHVVNVCFLAIEIGLALGYERARLIELGIAALLHDLGIVGYLAIINKAEKLSLQDYNKIKEHPKTGLSAFNSFCKEFPDFVFEVIAQEHERIDGSGYPRGLKGEEVSEYAQIVGLADVYEALIHQRPHRAKMTPAEATSAILKNKKAFSYKVVKALIERIGIFPVGFRVRLNSKEIGVVAKANPKSPFSPVVDILFDPSGKKLDKPKQVDLSGNPVIYIEECLDCLKKEP